ncbi:hypothetical protein QZM19_16810 [Burkholderia multivorans]|uniref:4-fold beta flower protein n=1 Tax=Burkholderia multivorans TaxID=87883 RepID=UPI0011B28DB1|nr:hypothetical protein [Burkholderia multivorans]MDN7865052.1 hypothetical protein [Burkholderia multivorans]
MLALYQKNGAVYAWLDETSGRILDLRGKNLAFVDGDSVYGWNGRHIGWWQDGHIRDQNGAVAMFTDVASNLGVVAPVKAVRPVQPIKSIAPIRPVKSVKPIRPVRQLSWAAKMPF